MTETDVDGNTAPAQTEALVAMRAKARREVAQAYELIADMARVQLRELNRERPWSQRYTRASLLHEYTSRAGAMSHLAVSLGLITPGEAGEIIRAFARRHPDVVKRWRES